MDKRISDIHCKSSRKSLLNHFKALTPKTLIYFVHYGSSLLLNLQCKSKANRKKKYFRYFWRNKHFFFIFKYFEGLSAQGLNDISLEVIRKVFSPV